MIRIHHNPHFGPFWKWGITVFENGEPVLYVAGATLADALAGL